MKTNTELLKREYLFAELSARLVIFAIEQGYEVAIAPPSGGLSLTLNLYREGSLSYAERDYETLGKWWQGKHPLCKWGGEAQYKDMRRFSVLHPGRP